MDEGTPSGWIYGRTALNATDARICPGRHFALRNLHLVIANILAVFDILPPLDENGSPQPPPATFKHSQVRSVRSFTGRRLFINFAPSSCVAIHCRSIALSSLGRKRRLNS